MTKHIKEKILFVKQLKKDIYVLSFRSPYLAQSAQPGQFVHIKIDEQVTILRRPFSIHKIEKQVVYLLFRVRGRGTKILAQYTSGSELDIIGPLGNGFHYREHSSANTAHILIAGGMGVAPLVFLASKLRETQGSKLKSKNVVLLGAKNKNEVLAEQEFRKLGYEVRIATDDGSRGFRGTVVALLRKIITAHYASHPVRLYACGPKDMFYEIAKITRRYRAIQAEVSFEQFMGCGLGVCCGCVIETKNGYKKVCKDGPVFDVREI